MMADHPDRRDIVMPAYTCPALAKVALDLNMRPRFADISPDTLSFEDTFLQSQVTEQTLAVICVHPFGIPQPVAPVQERAHAVGAVVVEDAAQALGATLNGQPVGTQGDFGLFSMGPGKPLSTGGGGILCAKDEHRSHQLEHAWQELPMPTASSSAWTLFRLALLTVAFHPLGWWLVTRINLHRVGEHEATWAYALRGLSGPQAAIGFTLLKRLDKINHSRRENARLLTAHLQEIKYIHFPMPSVESEPIYLRMPIIVDSRERRERLFNRLWAAGIGVGRMYQHPLPDLFPQVGPGAYPGASHVARHLLTLPTHHYLTSADVQRITQVFESEASVR